VKIYHYPESERDLRMSGIQFFDKDNVSILKAGYWTEDSRFKEHQIDLEEGERILGVKWGNRNKSRYHYYDVQLIIGKMVE
jgi:hypothetical protein